MNTLIRGTTLCALLLILVLAQPGSSYNILLACFERSVALVPLAWAAGLIISCGKIDIASGALFSVVGMIMLAWMTYLVPQGMPLELGLLGAVFFTAMTYLIMATIIVLGRVSALLCTLSFLFLGQGISVTLNSLLKCSAYFQRLCRDREGSLTIPTDYLIDFFSRNASGVWLLVILGALMIWRYRSESGLRHIAVGMDAQAAKIAGIKTNQIYFAAFAMSGVLVACSALIRLFAIAGGGWSPNTGWGYELLVIASAVLGGCRITGGKFNPIVITVATVLISAVMDAIDGAGFAVELVYPFFGLGLVVVALLDAFVDTAHRAGRE